ncbi:hypothetical protein P3S67_015488 [Capsicum chacoense]
MGRVEVEDALDIAYQNDISSIEEKVDDELVGELQHSEGLYGEFDSSYLRFNVNDYGDGTSGSNDEEDPTDENEISEKRSLDENETSEEELLDDNETSDEEELMNNYETSDED